MLLVIDVEMETGVRGKVEALEAKRETLMNWWKRSIFCSIHNSCPKGDEDRETRDRRR